MGATAAVHPTDQTLRFYGLGELDDASAKSVNKHLEGCAACQRRVAEMSSDSFPDRRGDAHVQPVASGPFVSSFEGLSVLEGGASLKAPPPTDTLPPGLANHPDYTVVRELGKGGMGTVYLALNRLMSRHEVLKVVSRHLMNRSGAVDRFLGEIRSAARLHHTNIVTAYSAMHIGDSVVFAMEYVDGLDLSKLVKAKGPLPVSNACNYVHQAALGLQHASELGMVHRDVKPSNLMLAKQGNRAVIKVLDFGLAKVKSEGTVDGGLTYEGQLLGTPDYVAPEQISDARRADIRADIYSLGCTLYYLLTGSAPFHATSLYEILQAHHSMDALPLNLARPEVPVELAALVARMMAKEPERRFQTPKEVAHALLPFFKKGIAGATGPKAVMSQTGGADDGRASTGVRSAPTQPTPTTPPPSAPLLETPSVTPGTEPTSEGLIDFKETKHFEEPAQAVTGSAHLSRWIWPSVAVGLLLAGLIVARGVIVRVKTANGVIVVENVPEHAVLEVDGERITVVPAAGNPVRIETRAGKHVVVVKRDYDLLMGESVTIETGKESTLSVRMEPRVASLSKEDHVESKIESPAPAKLPEKLPKDAGGDSRTSENGARLDTVQAAKPRSSKGSIKNSIGMTLELIPAGEFMMGAPGDEAEVSPGEKPQHNVRISPFYLGVTEVTQAQYQAVMGNNPSHFSSTGDGKDQVAGRSTVLFPVERVMWMDAVRFCDKLSKHDGRDPFYAENAPNKLRTTKIPGYRLPTEAEWEYACRAGSITRYCFGNGTVTLSEYGWFGPLAERMTHPVAQKLPNRFGLYDMHGNVTEWCSDWFDDAYYQQAPVNDPPGPPVGTHRVIRGGSWHHRARGLRSADRFHDAPGVRRPYRGFRVALGLERTYIAED